MHGGLALRRVDGAFFIKTLSFFIYQCEVPFDSHVQYIHLYFLHIEPVCEIYFNAKKGEFGITIFFYIKPPACKFADAPPNAQWPALPPQPPHSSFSFLSLLPITVAPLAATHRCLLACRLLGGTPARTSSVRSGHGMQGCKVERSRPDLLVLMQCETIYLSHTI